MPRRKATPPVNLPDPDDMSHADEDSAAIIDDLPQSFLSPESTSIRGAHYDASTRQLFIDFIDGGDYRYSDVGPQMWKELLESKSRGSFIARMIRPMYVGTRLKAKA